MNKLYLCSILTFGTLLVLPTVSSPYQERVILSKAVGECSLRVEADDESHTLRLRVHPEYLNCAVTKDAMHEALKEAFSKTEPPRLDGIYSSLYLGRIIDYPWLSEYLAVSAYKDPHWDRKRGKPVSMDINKYVSAILSKKELVTQLEGTFGDSGYGILSASVQKVLIGRFDDVPLYRGQMAKGRVPYDAQVWFRLEKK